MPGRIRAGAAALAFCVSSLAAVPAGPAAAGDGDATAPAATLRPLRPPLSSRLSYLLESGFSFEPAEAVRPVPQPQDVEALSAQKLEGLADSERWMTIAVEQLRRGEKAPAHESARRALAAFSAAAKAQPSDATLVRIVCAADLIRSTSAAEQEAADRIAATAAEDAAAGPLTWSWCGMRSSIRAVEIASGKPVGVSWTLDECRRTLAKTREIAPAAVRALAEGERLTQRAVEASAGPGTDPAVRTDVLSRGVAVHMIAAMLRAGTGDEAAALESLRGGCDDVLELAAARPDLPEAVVAGVMFGTLADRRRPFAAAEPTAKEQAQAREAIERLETLAKGPDRDLASRAWHGVAMLRFGVLRDPDAARACVLRAVEADPGAERSWIGGAGLLREAERWKELCAWCEKWSAARDGPLCRGTWAHAEWMRGDRAAAERRWRSLLGTGPEDFRARIGLASCLLARGGAAALDEAESMLRTAREAHPDEISSDRDTWSCWMEHTTVLALLRGERDDAESAARWILEEFPGSETAKAVLKALGK